MTTTTRPTLVVDQADDPTTAQEATVSPPPGATTTSKDGSRRDGMRPTLPLARRCDDTRRRSDSDAGMAPPHRRHRDSRMPAHTYVTHTTWPSVPCPLPAFHRVAAERARRQPGGTSRSTSFPGATARAALLTFARCRSSGLLGSTRQTPPRRSALCAHRRGCGRSHSP